MDIYIYNNGVKVAKTSLAFDIVEDIELMRGWLMDFSIDNRNPIRKYIVPGSTYELEGQKFDITGFHSNSGAGNVTTVNTEHVSYRQNNYIVPVGYAFVGTRAQILADLLNVAVNSVGVRANTEFSVGTCADLGGTSFSLGNEQEVSLRSALLAMQSIGVEPSYDNFTIHLPVRIGSATGRTFKFGVDLISLDRTWDRENGTTYEISVAAIGRLPGAVAGDKYALGDNVSVEDDIISDTVSRRIVKYTKCHDKPELDAVTLGVFIRDSATNAIAMQVDIMAAQDTADGAVQVGQSYNNVSISHERGFESTSSSGLMRTINNGTDGFVIQQKLNGSWKTIWEAKSSNGGKTIAYNLDQTQKVEMGGAFGLTTWTSADGRNTWTQTGGMDTSGAMSASKIMELGSNVYAQIGNRSGIHGLNIVEGSTEIGLSFLGEGLRLECSTANDWNPVLDASDIGTMLFRKRGSDSVPVVYATQGGSSLRFEPSNTTGSSVVCTADGISFFKDQAGYGLTQGIIVSTPSGNRSLNFKSGILISVTVA